jgi:hypothetical protein
MQRLKRFDTARSEGAKLLLADALFEEAIQPYKQLRIFKETTINSTDTGGLMNYRVTLDGAVPIMPFLCCVSEAKKDDFDKVLAQCLVEMQACFEINQHYARNPRSFRTIARRRASGSNVCVHEGSICFLGRSSPRTSESNKAASLGET